ncbi:MAG: hypothetical protein IKK67_09005 [Bacteroidaceae bacterium]|nr:hypothetical protein [Bacteroidaceae bacterium]
MKRLISLVAVLACMAVGYAQSALVATLNHGEAVSVFYGASALAEAYDAATHGDVITLSNGTFNSVNIAKNITVRGAGMDETGPCTRINGNFNLYGVPDSVDATGHLTLEGLYHDGEIYYTTKDSTYTSPIKNAHFVKCRLRYITQNGKGVLRNALFLQCRIKERLYFGSNDCYAHCINSVIYNPHVSSSSKDTQFEFTNCLVVGSPDYWDHSLFTNCILKSTISHYIPSSCMVSNCLGIGYSNSTIDIFQKLYPANKYGTIKEADIATIFKTFIGTYTDTETFELTDEAKAQYLGTDGTEVGIYGGSLPFTTESSLPKIKKFNVASKSTEDGKLKVEIEVSGVE